MFSAVVVLNVTHHCSEAIKHLVNTVDSLRVRIKCHVQLALQSLPIQECAATDRSLVRKPTCEAESGAITLPAKSKHEIYLCFLSNCSQLPDARMCMTFSDILSSTNVCSCIQTPLLWCLYRPIAIMSHYVT